MAINYRLVAAETRIDDETGQSSVCYVNVFPDKTQIGRNFNSISKIIPLVESEIKKGTFGPYEALRLVQTQTFYKHDDILLYPNGQTTYIDIGCSDVALDHLKALKKPTQSKKSPKQKPRTKFVLYVQKSDPTRSDLKQQNKNLRDIFVLGKNPAASLVKIFPNVNPKTLIRMMLIKTVIKGDGEPSVRRMEFYTVPYTMGTGTKSNYACYVNQALLKTWDNVSALPEKVVNFLEGGMRK